MKKLLLFPALAMLLTAGAAQAQERLRDGVIGAGAGAIVGGPVGAVVGGAAGYIAGPAVTRAVVPGHRVYRRHRRHR